MRVADMGIKMAVFDLDGTLLRTDKTISERTKTALHLCQNKGIKTAYATGRGSSAAIIVPPGLFDGKITMNGSVARAGNKIVYNSLIPCLTARPFLLACDKRGLKMTSELTGMHYTNFTIPDDWTDVVRNWEITDFSKHDKDAEKICTSDLTTEDIAFITDNLPANLYMVMAADGLAMIMHNDATKAKAVAALANHWEIAQSEIIAFGDDLNDIDLLEFAEVSVAMGNALDNVKAVANHICDTNDNDGAAKWMEENLL